MSKKETTRKNSRNNSNKNKPNSSKDDSRSKSKDSKDQIFGLTDGDFFKGTVKILRKTQPGPVILVVSDGKGCVEAVSMECRYEVDDVVDLLGNVEERSGKLQIRIKGIKKSDKDFDSMLEKNSEPARREQSIKSDKLKQLNPHFKRIAKKIRLAILKNQPILIRHHASCIASPDVIPSASA